MSSLRRIIASRANGALSRGPVTAAGKARSSRNSIRHGLFSKCMVLSNESPAGFREWSDQFMDRFGPFDGVEQALVEEMIAASWRLRRIWAIESRVLDDALDAQPPGDEIGRLAAAFRSLATRPELNLIHRYETRFHTMSQHALYNLFLMRTPGMQNDPTMDLSEFDAAPAALPPVEAEIAPADPSGCKTNLGSC